MRRTAIISLAALVCSAAAGAPPAHKAIEKSPDVLPAAKARAKSLASRVDIPLVLAPEVLAAAAVTPEDVGDADSFGKNVIYLGTAQTMSVTLADDCTGSDPAFDRCILNNPAPASTLFDEADLATINLPAKATKSLICFAFTPFINISWINSTPTVQTASFTASATISIENDVLDDPTLIDPNTGLPFGGVLQLGLSTWHKFKSIQPGEFEEEISSQSRNCIAGIVSKRALVESYGLTDAQATQFFKKPMTIRFGSRGQARMSQQTSYFYGIRLYGDK